MSTNDDLQASTLVYHVNERQLSTVLWTDQLELAESNEQEIMGPKRRSPPGVIFVFLGLFTHRFEVLAFSFKTSALTVRPTHESSHSSRTAALGVGGATSSDTLGDQIASMIVNSPIYPLLTRQARDTMKTSAEVMTALFLVERSDCRA